MGDRVTDLLRDELSGILVRIDSGYRMIIRNELCEKDLSEYTTAFIGDMIAKYLNTVPEELGEDRKEYGHD